VILPLAHHNAIVALPVFAPAVVIVLLLVVHHLRERRHWDDEDEASPVA
jgi:GAF domain-containing protein